MRSAKKPRLKSVHVGAQFENDFVYHCQLNQVAVTRIPDGCKRIGRGLIRVKSPWDFVLSFQTSSAYLDTKTTGDSTFSYSDIDQKQIDAMMPHNEQGIRTGYIIAFRKLNTVVYATYAALRACRPREGISPHSPGVISLGAYTGGVQLSELYDPRRIFWAPRITTLQLPT